MLDATKDVLCLPEVLEVILRGLVCMLEAVDGVLHALELPEVLEIMIMCWK
jgi:hypothetical protein